MGIVLSSSGLLTNDTFASVSAWVLGAQWASINSPTYIASPRSPIIALTYNPIPGGGSDGSGTREGMPFVDDDGTWVMQYCAGDGTTANPAGRWRTHIAISTNRGLTWNKHGSWGRDGAADDTGIQKTNDPADGSWAGRETVTINKFSGAWVMNAFIASSLIGASLPINGYPYLSDFWTASNRLGPWTFVRGPIGLGAAPSYDDGNYYGMCTLKIGSTYNLFSGTFHDGVGQCSFGLATSSSPTGPFTKIGQIFDATTAIRGKSFNSFGILSVLENARIWWSAALNMWAMTANYSYAFNANTTYGNLVFTGPSPIDWRGNTTSLQVQSLSPDFGAGAIGMTCPFYRAEGLPVITSDGYVPMVYDTDPPDTSGTEVHLHRSLRYNVLEPSPFCLDYDTTRGGTGLTTARKTLSHTNFIAEFHVEYPFDTAIPGSGGLSFDYRIQANGTDFYRLSLTASGLVLLKYVGATSLATSSGTIVPNFRNIHRVRVSVSGNTHQAWLDGELQITYTDSSSPFTSGTSYGFAASGYSVRVRLSHLRTSNTVTINGLTSGQVVTLRAHGEIPLVTTTAASSSVILTHTHFPAAGIDVDGIVYDIPNRIYGGDVYSFDRNTSIAGVSLG